MKTKKQKRYHVRVWALIEDYVNDWSNNKEDVLCDAMVYGEAKKHEKLKFKISKLKPKIIKIKK